MKTRTRLALSLTVVSTVLGFMISMEYRQTQGMAALGLGSAGTFVVNRRLTSELNQLKSSNSLGEQHLAALSGQISDYEEKSTGSNRSLQKLQERVEDERILAGLTPVYGPGISVTLMDGLATNNNVEQSLTHDWDVRSLVNELFTAGAEAISINGFRVVATSAVNCQGPVVTVNDHKLGAPFVIQAIGDPATLKSAITMQGGILDAFKSQGLHVTDPTVVSKIEMPAYTGALQAGNSEG